ncbi:MAG: hypothetical protein WAU70_02745 [Flavobacteriales bacterium]
MPRTPSGKEMGAAAGDGHAGTSETQTGVSMEQRVAEAAALVQGADPMKGIMALRGILAEDSNNVEAHWQLGLFSMQSGQLDKAVGRFRKVTELAPARAEAWLELGRSYAAIDSLVLAKEALMKYKTMVTDPAAQAAADAIIEGNTNEKQ